MSAKAGAMEEQDAQGEGQSGLVASVLKAISILHCFEGPRYRQSITDLSQRLGFPKSTVHALVKTLVAGGLLEQDCLTSQYCLSPEIIALSRAVRVNVELRDRAAPILRQLADDCRESVYLTVLDRKMCLYIYTIESPRRLLAVSALGDRVHLHCAAVGKAIMAYLPAAEVDDIIRTIGLPGFTANTITDPQALREELGRVRECGYAFDLEEHEPTVCCAAAPIRDSSGRVFAACSISGRRHQGDEEALKHWATLVVSAADAISRRMGYVPSAPSLIVGQPM